MCVCMLCACMSTLVFKCGLEQPANILSTIYHASAKSEVSCNDCNISARPQVLVFIIECFNVFFDKSTESLFIRKILCQ